MEGIFFVLIGAVLFSQSWYTLGLYSEGRVTGIHTGGLGLVLLGILMFGANLDMVMLTGDSLLSGSERAAHALEHGSVFKTLIIVWALYAIGVSATAIWEFEDRAIGFYSAFVAVVSLISFLYFAIELQGIYTDSVWLSISGACLALTVLSGMTFVYLSLQLGILRLVSGWFNLLGSCAIIAIGLAILTTSIT